MKNAVKLLLLFCVFGALANPLFASPFHGLPYKTHKVVTPDGAELVLFEIMANEAGNVVEFKPGFLQTAEAVDDPVLKLVQEGNKVFIGQVRLAGRGNTQSGRGVENRLEDVINFDAPTLTEKVIELAGGRTIDIIGYSMGGLQLAALESNPYFKARLFPHVESRVYMGAVVNFKHLPRWVKLMAKGLLPAFKAVQEITKKDTIKYTSIFDLTLRLKNSGNPVLSGYARVLESSFMVLGNLILRGVLADLRHMSPVARRRLWLKDISPLPLQIIITFAEAAASKDGEIRDSRGRKLVDLSLIDGPALVVGGTKDALSPETHNITLFKNLGGAKNILKKKITLENVRHVTLTHADKPRFDFMKYVTDFIRDPVYFSEIMADDLIIKEPGICEQLLNKAAGWLVVPKWSKPRH